MAAAAERPITHSAEDTRSRVTHRFDVCVTNVYHDESVYFQAFTNYFTETVSFVFKSKTEPFSGSDWEGTQFASDQFQEINRFYKQAVRDPSAKRTACVFGGSITSIVPCPVEKTMPADNPDYEKVKRVLANLYIPEFPLYDVVGRVKWISSAEAIVSICKRAFPNMNASESSIIIHAGSKCFPMNELFAPSGVHFFLNPPVLLIQNQPPSSPG